MQPPATPIDETARLAELRALDILDTAPEERFDRYTRLARRLFGVPIALVSLVDATRQWFKSRQGLDAPQTGRDVSFCGHAILESQVFVIENAAEDPRFRDNPLVTADPNIRFYAGCPLPGPGGQLIGTLCIIDRKPRQLSAEDLEALRDIGEMVAHELAALQMATVDDLTGLSNRRGFNMLARQALAMCTRSGQPATLALIDLDGFKPINDRFGHEEGDRALREFSDLLRSSLRDSDIVARVGGDEFVAVLTGTDEEGSHNAFERVYDALERRNRKPACRYPLWFSCGLAACSSEADLAQALGTADTSMYRDKARRKKGTASR